MEVTRWYLVIGALLILLVVTGSRVKRLPLTTAMLYLGVGWFLGFVGWIQFDPLPAKTWLEHFSEVAVIVSLFSAGLKLRLPLRSKKWRTPVALAFLSMAVTVGLITALGVYWLGFPLGMAIILAAVLAPTDPVLASDVQVEHPHDPERVRFTLTAEAGLNDGTAFPFIMLGLGLLGLHELGVGGWRWWILDVFWAILGGLGCGALSGMAVGRLVIYLRRSRREAVGLDDFLALGLIGFTYGAALLLHVYGFLAVFAAGLALRTVERSLSGDEAPSDVKAAAAAESDPASHPQYAPAMMANAVLQFNEQLERLCELALVLIVGALLVTQEIHLHALAFALVIFLVIRPLAVAPLAKIGGFSLFQTALVAWFGVRGIGSIYYLFYAVGKGIPDTLAAPLVSLTLAVIMLSIIAHGITVTPLMDAYEKRRFHRDRTQNHAPGASRQRP